MHKLILVCVAIAACDDGTDHSGNTSVPTIADYQRVAVDVFCNFYGRCGLFSKSSCKTTFASIVASGMTAYSIEEAEAAGRLHYDAVAAQQCIDALSGATCDLAGLTLLSASYCRNILKGLVQPGGLCKADPECAGGYCMQANNDAGCPGTCVAFIPRGMACTGTTEQCGPEDYCDPMSSLCRALGAAGDPCTSSFYCQPGLGCRAATVGATLSCQPPAGEGAACTGTGSSQCASGLYCESNTCKRKTGAGTACTSSTSCLDQLTCVRSGMSGTCQPIADINQSCATSGCASDAVCDPATQTCQERGTVGSDCSASGSCGLFTYCNASMKCAAKVPFGGTCDPAEASSCITGDCSPTSHTCVLMCT
jgi:hypothetical protein